MKTIADGNAFDAEVTKQTGIVLVDFYTDDCAPCRMMMPVLEELSNEQNDFKIVKVDAAANLELAANFRVSAVPTFVLFNNGQVKGQFTGARSKKNLLAWIDSNR
jgi:thioredoxin 1